MLKDPTLRNGVTRADELFGVMNNDLKSSLGIDLTNTSLAKTQLNQLIQSTSSDLYKFIKLF